MPRYHITQNSSLHYSAGLAFLYGKVRIYTRFLDPMGGQLYLRFPLCDSDTLFCENRVKMKRKSEYGGRVSPLYPIPKKITVTERIYYESQIIK